MKTALLFLLCAAGCFTGGYFAGKSGEGPAARDGASRGEKVAAGPKGIGGGASAVTAGAVGEVREFLPGRPFPPGGAKAWLLSLAAKLKESGGGDFPIELVDLGQIFMTMDEGSITEVGGAIADLMAMLKADDPLLKSISDADDILEGAYLVSAFRLSQLNPSAALDLLKRTPEDLPDEVTKLIFARIAAKDPAQAERMLAGLEEKDRKEAVNGMIKGMMGRDAAGAVALAAKYPDSLGSYETNNLLERMIERDPAEGMAAAVKLTEKKDADVLLGAFGNWAEKDPKAAEAWALNYKGPGEVSLRALALKESSSADPAAAAQAFMALQKEATPQDRLGEVAYAIADELADEGVSSAAAWAETLPPGDSRNRAMIHSMHRWLAEDPTAASAWLNKQPQGEERDNLASELIDSIRSRDPAAAFEWARNIQNPEQRTNQIRGVIDSWDDQDPDAAKAAKESLPADLRKGLP